MRWMFSKHLAVSLIRIPLLLRSFSWLVWTGSRTGWTPIDLLNGLPDAGFASILLAQQWLEDGIEQDEVDVLKALSRIAHSDPAAATILAGLDWVADGLDSHETRALLELATIADGGPGAGLQILENAIL